MATKKGKTSPKKASKKTVKKSPKVTAKKSSVKKTSPKKKAAAKKAPAKKLSSQLSRLVSLTENLSGEEVDFLISQAETMVRNREILKERETRSKNREKVVAAMNPVKDKENIEIIEDEAGSHFIIVLGTERNFFARDEMKKIVRLCHAADDEQDAMRRLYTWFDRFRGDVLRNNDIGSGADPALKTMYQKIIRTYAVAD